MTKLDVFNKLADLVNDLERQVWQLPHSAAKLALEALVDRFDALVDGVITMNESSGEEE